MAGTLSRMPCTTTDTCSAKTQKVVVGLLIKNSDIFYSCKHTGLGPKRRYRKHESSCFVGI
jgi:hypothetical protein